MKKKLLFLLAFILLLAFVRTRLSFYNLNRHPIVIGSVESTMLSSKSIIDGNVESGSECSPKPDKTCDVVVNFPNPTNISYIEIFFSSGLVKNIQSEYKTSPDGQWTSLSEIKDNNFNRVEILTPILEKNKTSAVKLVLDHPISNDDLVGIGEIRGFYRSPLNTLTDTARHVFMVKRAPLSDLFYSLLILSITFLLGFGISPRPNKPITPINISLIWMKGIAMVSLFGVARLVTESDKAISILLFVISAISLFKYLKSPAKISKEASMLLILSAVYLFNLFLFYSFSQRRYTKLVEHYDEIYDNSHYYPTPYGVYESDFLIPFGVTKIWRYHLPSSNEGSISMMAGYKPSDRTPLLSLYILPFLSIFGDRHFISEVISIVISPAFLIGFWVALSRIFNNRVATLATILLTFNHWIFFATHFGQVRLLVLFFLSLYLYYSHRLLHHQDKESIIMASITSTLAFLSHPFVLAYIFPVVIYQCLLYRNRSTGKIFTLLFKIYLLPAITLVLWQIWARSEPGNSLLISSMVSSNWESTNGVMHLLKPAQIDDIQKILISKIDNMMGIFIPNPRMGVIRSYGFLRTTFFPALGLIITPLTLLSLLFVKAKSNMLIIYYFLSVVFFTTIIFLSFYAILGLNWYHVGLIPLLTGIASVLVIRLPKWMQATIIVSVIAEYYYVTYVFFSFEAGSNLYESLQNQNWVAILIASMLLLQSLSVLHIWQKQSGLSVHR